MWLDVIVRLFFFHFFPRCELFCGLLSYLVGMKRRTSKHVTSMRDYSHFLCYVLIFPDV